MRASGVVIRAILGGVPSPFPEGLVWGVRHSLSAPKPDKETPHD